MDGLTEVRWHLVHDRMRERREAAAAIHRIRVARSELAHDGPRRLSRRVASMTAIALTLARVLGR